MNVPHPHIARSDGLPSAAAGLLALFLGACSGEGDEVYELAGSIEGASFAPASPQDAGSTTPAAPVAAAERRPDQPARVGDAAATPGHDPSDGVRAVKPANLPKDVRYLAFEDVTWSEYEPLDLRDVDAEAYGTDDFPAEIAGLDGVRVAFDGYMVPVDFEERRVTSFILSRYLSGCCFGLMPRMDEWIEVDVLGERGVEYFPYQIVRVTGTFEVGELLDDYGYVRSIYRIRADEVQEQL